MKRLSAALLALLICSACGEEQTGKIKEVDQVKQDHGGYDRPDKIISFLTNVEKKKPDQILVTGITIEGDPIVTEMVFDGEVIEYTFDTRQDRYGSRKLTERRCKPEFTKFDRVDMVEYALENCYGTSGAYGIFFLPKE